MHCCVLCSQGDAEAPNEEEKRDRGKAKKFQKLADSGAIPEHILHLIEEESKKSNQPRKAKTALINRLFEADGKGDYKMTAHKPVFENHKEAYHKKYGKDENAGTPKARMKWQVFQGNEKALEDAIASGAVQEYQSAGVTFCAFRKHKAGVEKASMSTSKLEGGKKEVTQPQLEALGKAFKAMAWTFDDPALSSHQAATAPAGDNRAYQRDGRSFERC